MTSHDVTVGGELDKSDVCFLFLFQFNKLEQTIIVCNRILTDIAPLRKRLVRYKFVEIRRLPIICIETQWKDNRW
jgi:hypothetical protein